MRRVVSVLFWTVVVMVALVACDTTIPTAPPVTVNITVVPNTTALGEAVHEALVMTDEFNIGATETVLAQGGVTLTPSRTPTITLTPTVTPTRFVTLTPTPTPSNTTTPTFAPYLTNTPGAVGDSTNGWLRIINAWREISATVQENPVDVFINNERVSRALSVGQQTTYYRVLAGAVRVTLRPVDPDVSNVITTPPLASTVVDILPGGIASVVAVNRGKGLELIPVSEDPAPLPSGMARLTVLQAAPTLLESNLLIPSLGRALAYNLVPGSLVGPFDLPLGDYPSALYDSENPDQLITLLSDPVRLSNRVNYLMVLLAPSSSSSGLVDVMFFSGITRKLDTDLGVRFVNISTRNVTILVDSQVQITSLPAGAISDSIPVSMMGASLMIRDDQDHLLAQDPLGPWTNPDEQRSGKIVMLTDSTIQSEPVPITLRTLSQNAPTSAINANVRLIHGLPNTRPLTIQVRPVRTKTTINVLGTPQVEQLAEDEVPWITLGDATQLGSASTYASRTPEIYNVRVVLSGSSDVIGNPITVQLLPGGVYDFIALPGGNRGSFSLVLLEPDTQIGGGGSSSDNATAVSEAVNATLTAQAPRVTATPSRANTSTPTRTPVATNTPRPSNTPSILPASVQVKPEPPLTALDTITVTGQNFVPGKLYAITIDNKADIIANGTINADGSLSEVTIPLKSDLAPGSHTLKLCVDCVLRGSPLVQYAVFVVADPNVTATPTPIP